MVLSHGSYTMKKDSSLLGQKLTQALGTHIRMKIENLFFQTLLFIFFFIQL